MAVPSTSCIKITHTHTSNISCTTSRFIQGPQRPRPSIFKDYTDTISAALCQLLDRVQWWIFMEGTRIKTNAYFERDCAFLTFKWYSMDLEVNCRCYSSREGWQNVIMNAVSCQSRTSVDTEPYSASVKVCGNRRLLAPTLWHRLLSEVYFVGHSGNCHIFCWTLWPLSCILLDTGDFTVRCILLDAVYAVRRILLDTLATASIFCWTLWPLSCLLLDTGDFTVRCILLDAVYAVRCILLDTGNCHTFS